MQIEKLPSPMHPRRPTRRRPVKSRRQLRGKQTRLKYGNLISLVATSIIFCWLVTLPFKTRRPAVAPQPPELTLPGRPVSTIAPTPQSEPQPEQGFIYNIKTPPHQVYSTELQKIVDELVAIAARKKLPLEPLSISLIDVSNASTHTFAGYQNQILRFPASVAKLFWMVAFYGAVEKGLINDESKFYSDLDQMLRVSNNDAASRILDKITDTKSGGTLSGATLENWLKKRKQVNEFFQAAGYDGIILSTKNYPIHYLGQEGPKGRDLQLRTQTKKFLRNQITTDHVARVMYEIYTKQAISPIASRKMAYLLTRDLNPKAWRNDPTNGIKGFLGESLPTNLYFGSKVGYTSRSRQEAAFVRTLDDKAIYILVIFAEDPAYARDEKIFPALSRHVFDRLYKGKR